MIDIFQVAPSLLQDQRQREQRRDERRDRRNRGHLPLATHKKCFHQKGET